MTRKERAALREKIRTTAQPVIFNMLLNALDEKDALIAELLDFSEEGWAYASDYFKAKWKYEEQLAALKARAEK